MKKILLLALSALTVSFLPACKTDDVPTHTTTTTTETSSMHAAPTTVNSTVTY